MAKRTLAAVLLVLVIVISGSYIYIRSRSENMTIPTPSPVVVKTNPSQLTTTTKQSSNSIVNAPTNTLIKSIASSTAQVGNFTVIANCNITSDDSGYNNASVYRIDILKGGLVVQTIPTRSIDVPSLSCPNPQSQDINFDGYPDLFIPANAGSSGTSYYYWLFDTSTQQFSCPGGNYFECSLINPTFDSTSKTISEMYPMSASDIVLRIYKAKGDSLTLYQETDTNFSGTTTTKTMKQLENGLMQVVSTSTDP